MPIERLSPDRIGFESTGDHELDAQLATRYIEHDFRIRSGLCPNGRPDSHGLMQLTPHGQECPSCGFSTNALPDPEPGH
jgi:hypothetical protein